MHAAVEGHVRTGGDLEVHPGAVEDAELEEWHLDLAEDLGQAGARAVVAANLRGDEIVGDLSAEARVGPDRESRWIRVRRSRHDPGHRIIDEGELGIDEGGRRDAAELGRRGRRRAGEDSPQRHHARLDPRLGRVEGGAVLLPAAGDLHLRHAHGDQGEAQDGADEHDDHGQGQGGSTLAASETETFANHGGVLLVLRDSAGGLTTSA